MISKLLKRKANSQSKFFSMGHSSWTKKWFIYKVSHITGDPHKRIYFLFWFVVVFFWIIAFRLFFLQIVFWSHYNQLAFDQQYSRIEVPAKRWEILMSSSNSWEDWKVATNVSLNLLYIDPTNVPDKSKVAKELAPILFWQEEYVNCKENPKLCPSWNTVSFEEWITLESMPEARIKDNRSYDELVSDYWDEILKKISKEYNDYVPLKYWATDDEVSNVMSIWIKWVSVLSGSNIIYADPTQIEQTKLKEIAHVLSINIPDHNIEFFERNLKMNPLKYVPLKRKLSPEVSDKIMQLKIDSYEKYKRSWTKEPHYYKWVVLLKEHWRYYPEKELWAQVIWFVDHDGIWRYWIEEYFNSQLSWKNWLILNRKNIKWEFVFFDEKSVEAEEDGDTFVLTVDKIIQKKTEEILAYWVKNTNADSWEVIVMDPKTWFILASANYPSYDPNNFGDVYKIIPIKEFVVPDFDSELKPATPEEGVRLYYTNPVFVKDAKWKFVLFNASQAKEEERQIREGLISQRVQKYIYANGWWLQNYINNNFASSYEPWSIFKSVVVALWIDAKEVEPFTTYEEFWPIILQVWNNQVQIIRTAEWKYRWIQTVTNAIEQSSNIGLAFVARKLWKQVFYNYVDDFNFWDVLGIESPWEQTGQVEYWRKWNEAKLLTTSFWQWISVTPLQMAVSYSALANWWILVKPTLVKTIIKPDWTKIDTEVNQMRRVISERTSQQITAILVSSVVKWVAKAWWVKGYSVAGKTWTAQMACTDSHRCKIWTYEPKTEWHFITSYAWYAPASDPKFVIIVKINRARLWAKTYWTSTAAPVFSELTSFLLQYYWIPQTEKIKM